MQEPVWTDDQLRSLCSQAVYSMSDDFQGYLGMQIIREFIFEWVTEGSEVKSKFIPEDRRNSFALAIQQRFNFTYREYTSGRSRIASS